MERQTDGPTTTAMDVTLSNGMIVLIDTCSPADTLRVNKQGNFVYIKYHFIAKHGQKQLTQPEAIRLDSVRNPATVAVLRRPKYRQWCRRQG